MAAGQSDIYTYSLHRSASTFDAIYALSPSTYWTIFNKNNKICNNKNILPQDKC